MTAEVAWEGHMAAARHKGTGERRKNPRVVPDHEVPARLTSGEPVRILDLSVDGLSFEAASPIPPGQEATLLVDFEDEVAELTGEVTRSRITAAVGRERRCFVAGFRFGPQVPARVRERLEDLVVDLQLTEQDDVPQRRRAVIAVDVSR